MQPSAERAFKAKLGEALPDPHKGVLGKVFGTRSITTEQPQDHAMHAPDMAAIERFERRQIAGHRRAYQGVLVRVGRWGERIQLRIVHGHGQHHALSDADHWRMV